MSDDKKAFQTIADVVAENYPGIISIKLEAYLLDGHDYEFIVVKFKGGGISVRNARWNSLGANLAELARLLRGGYYAEVEAYNEVLRETKKRDQTNTGVAS